ncbi:flagellar motor stator protein MotA [Paracoccus ravus]|uniref:flagellar motor stator protein MotA n=1 Tax=Paracoccus ravus TaxID=2447760 RepID=UPI00106ECA91|nr:flagellar motor stator protein MotA [Paracoccus ravus]
MMILLGLVVVFGLVFGGYFLSGGSMSVILHALPYEGMMVGGAALGAFIMANSFGVIKGTLRAGGMAFRGPHWKPNDYSDLLKLLHDLSRTYKSGGAMGLEEHIENPERSSIFNKYPRISASKDVQGLIVDAFRMVTMEFDDPLETEEIINRKLEAHHKHVHAPIEALNTLADGLPAIGIIAAVLGVIKTMASVNQPPEILGGMIGGALVGTFLGVFLAYCFVMPLAQRATQVEEEDASVGHVIRDVIVAIIKGYPPSLCVEIGRGNIPPAIRPDFSTVEREIKMAA